MLANQTSGEVFGLLGFEFIFRYYALKTLKESFFTFLSYKKMVEPLLSGIVLGLVPVTIAGLFVTAYLQYRRGDLANF